jgi:hypothetical protein
MDVWSAGAVIAELLTLSPLFPGSNDIDQIYRVLQVTGSPTSETWPVSEKINPTFFLKSPYSMSFLLARSSATAHFRHIISLHIESHHFNLVPGCGWSTRLQ